MANIISFDDFTKDQYDQEIEQVEESNMFEADKEDHYMFFQNLVSIKHYIDEISSYNPDQVDALLKDGHDWACDHITTSKDDIQEIAEWLRGELGEGKGVQPIPSPESSETEEPEETDDTRKGDAEEEEEEDKDND